MIRMRLSQVEALSYMKVQSTRQFLCQAKMLLQPSFQSLLASSDLVFDLQLQRSDGPPQKKRGDHKPGQQCRHQNSNVTITADASLTGEVVRVGFYRDDDFLGADQQPPSRRCGVSATTPYALLLPSWTRRRALPWSTSPFRVP